MIRLSDYINKDLVIYSLKGKSTIDILGEFADLFSSRGLVKDKDKFLKELLQREELGSTAIDDGIAIPHCRLEDIDKTLVAVGISRSGVNFNSVDNKPTHLFFLLASPQKSTEEHLLALAAISHIARIKTAKQSLMNAKDNDEIIEIVKEWEKKN